MPQKITTSIPWVKGSRYATIVLGVLIGAVAVIVFMMPFDITPAGVTGISVILNHLLDTPIGLFILILNIPIQYLAYRLLPGSWRTVAKTIGVLLLYSFALDVLAPHFPKGGVSENVLLNAIFGGALSGIASGLIYRGGASWGGTSTLALILQRRLGTPMSSTFLYTDTLIVVLAGLVFGWEPALYALVAIFISGVATDYVLEGPSVVRTALIVTDNPETVAQAVMYQLNRGVTGWQVKGMYTGQERWMLYVSISRSEMRDLNELVMQTDPEAFISIVQGHVAYGEGFRQYRFAGGARKIEEKTEAKQPA